MESVTTGDASVDKAASEYDEQLKTAADGKVVTKS